MINKTKISTKILLLILFFNPTNLFAFEPPTNLSHYTIKAKLEEKNNTLICNQNIKITNTFKKPLKKLYFVLFNNQIEPNPFLPPLASDYGYINGFQPAPITITKAQTGANLPLKINYLPLSKHLRLQKFSEDKILFYLELPKPLLPKETTTILFKFNVKIPEVYNSVNTERWLYQDTYILRFGWYPVEVARDNKKWLLGKGQHAQHLIKKMELTIPKRFTTAVAGSQKNIKVYKDKKTITSKSDFPVISFPIAFSPNFNKISGHTNKGIKVNIYYLKETSILQAQTILDHTKETISYYSKWFWKPKFKVVNIVNSPYSGMWGMAANGTIILGDGAFSTAHIFAPNYFNRTIFHLLVHEIGHLWAGIGMPVDHISENVFSEGLTEFISFSFMEEKYGRVSNLFDPKSSTLTSYILPLIFSGSGFGPSFTARDDSHMGYTKLVKDNWDEPAITKIEDSNLTISYVQYYQKGFLLFKTLETYIGKETMISSLEEYFRLSAIKDSNLNLFKNIVEKKSKKNLDLFFDDWFFNSKPIDFSIKSAAFEKNNNKYNSTITINKKGSAPSNLEIEVTETNNQKQRKLLKNPQDNTKIRFTTQTPLKNISLDPDLNILETTKLNNKIGDNLDFYKFWDLPSIIGTRPLQNYFIGIDPVLGPLAFDSSSETGLGLKLIGKDHISHIWQIGTTYILDTNSAFNNSSGSLQIGGEISFLFSRGLTYSFNTVYDTREILESSLTARFPIYSEIETGYYGHAYYPETSFLFGLTRRDFGFSKPYYSLVSRLAHLSTQRLLFSTIRFELAPDIKGVNQEMYFKADLDSYLPTKLGSLILVPRIKAGYSQDLPWEMWYNNTQLRGTSLDKYGHNFLAVSLDMPFTLAFGLKEKAFNLGILRGFASSLFLEIGNTWSGSFSNWDQSKKINTGIEVSMLISTVADLKFPLTVGYGVNLINGNQAGNDQEFYFSSTTPLNLYTIIFGY